MAPHSPIKVEFDIPLRLRDGTLTYVDIFRPDASGLFPALLQRTPYDKTSAASRTGTIDAIEAARNGYAVVIQDVRGRFASDGEFYPFANEIDDGYDSVEWVASQPWSTGKVGMYGISYIGATQVLAAKSRPPSLAAIAPGMTASDYHEGWTWQGGAFELGFNLAWATALTYANWDSVSTKLRLPPEALDRIIEHKDDLTAAYDHLPMAELPDLKDGVAPYYYDWIANPEYNDYWKRFSIEESHGDITVPTFSFGGWYDIFLGGTIRNYTGMRTTGANEDVRRGQRLLIGPWVHSLMPTNLAGEQNFGTRSTATFLGLQGLLLRYFDHWVKGKENGLMDEKPVQIFVMGDNVWRFEDEWPLRRAESLNYYLHSGGKANTLGGDGSLSPASPRGEEAPDVYAYNPIDPVPTRGGALCCDPVFTQGGSYDQRSIETRSDVLVYSTPPLELDVEVTGPIIMALYASSSARDTDFTAKLVDVFPSGRALNLTDGIIRARYRTPQTAASLIEPGQVYEYAIDLWSTSNVFKKGHRIRLEVSSSNFPRFDRNANTGEAVGTDSGFEPALQTVYHTSQYPSHITLPIVPKA